MGRHRSPAIVRRPTPPPPLGGTRADLASGSKQLLSERKRGKFLGYAFGVAFAVFAILLAVNFSLTFAAVRPAKFEPAVS